MSYIGEIAEEMYSIFPFQESFFDRHLPVWHYTSASGLMGILENGQNCGKMKLWFSRSDCVNDISEGKNVLSFVKDVAKELFEKHEICKEIFEICMQAEIPSDRLLVYDCKDENTLKPSKLVKMMPCEAFICCFSSATDSLDMWRYYSKNDGGYALRFDLSSFELQMNKQLEKIKEPITSQSFFVIYDDKEKKEYVKKILVEANKVFLMKAERVFNYDGINAYISEAIKMLQYRFKHNCFSSEKEFRTIVYLPKEKPANYIGNLFPIKYRAQRGLIVPYVEIELNICQIKEIKISPYLQDKNAQKALESYVQQCDANTIIISRSTLPVRD